MPIYEFKCEECGNSFEIFINLDEKPICPKCGSEDVNKKISRVSSPSKSCSFTTPAGGSG